MATDNGGRRRLGVDWRRAEFVLTGLGILGFITLPIRITTIYGGLPAHPLFVHLPVVLIPVTILTAIVCMVKLEWFTRYGIVLSVLSIGAMSSIFVTMQAGAALESALHLRGRAAHLISEHSQAAHDLAFIYVAFTAIVIVTFASHRISSGLPTGLRVVDRMLRLRGIFMGLRIVLISLSLGAAVMVFRVGDLGAKAVWQGRLQPGDALTDAALARGVRAGPQSCARTFMHCAGLPHRSCRQTTIQSVFGSHPLEIDVFGRNAPGCRGAGVQLGDAATRLHRGRWGVIDGWRCRWRIGAESCARSAAVLWATDPGE